MIRIIRGAALTLAAALALSACGGGGDDDPLGGGGAGGGGSQTLVVGSADFPESELLGEIYAQALEAKDIKVERKFKIGAREVYYGQVAGGSIQVFPEYNGALLERVDQGNKASTTQEVDAALKEKLPPELEILNASQAEDKDALVVTGDTARKHSLKTIADLKDVAGDMVVGGPPEFKTRRQGMVGLQEVYGLKFKQFKSLDTAGPITVSNLSKGQVQAANLFTTDPAIAKNGFVALEDPENVFGAQNVVPLVYKSKVNETARAALNAVSAKLTTADLLAMNGQMAEQKLDPEDVAQEWLKKQGLI
ncbi:osmoprotectant transport system substrate-binding protein [Thermomonospora echinospora]|uniref:Osmoprotectant transport system substrate-binding protein n=1 Tax=Thermomonospora echinospora TaxID=1992 RepID=A0A1H5V246_9ACTN|nr:ABC transporter substrate-binding protein [Thermomonospora echinospora]SEF80798.1 osmoprotectant transport system substrate-binding protein [Thermomonospora echinospora]